MCDGMHYGEVEGLVSLERWSCSRGASCVVEYTVGRLRGGLLTKGSTSFKALPLILWMQCWVSGHKGTRVQARQQRLGQL